MRNFLQSSFRTRLDAFGFSRGLVLDLFAFGLNLAAATALAGTFRELVRRAADDDPAAHRILAGMGVAMFLLAPVGATLGRWHYHQRRRARDVPDPAGGCLFNPIFYFCLTAVVFASVNAYILQTALGRQIPEGVAVGSVFVGLGLMIAHTGLAYRYFSAPRNPPRSAFLRSRASVLAADACLFANMALFQSVWSLLGAAGLPRVGGIGDLLGRLAVFAFLALLLYFPPRMFYLAEDIGKRRTWAMILLANSPILYRFVAGIEGSGPGW